MSKKNMPKRKTYKDLKEEEKQKLMLFHLMKKDLISIPIVIGIAGMLLIVFGFIFLVVDFPGETNISNLNLTDITVKELTWHMGKGIVAAICLIGGYLISLASMVLYVAEKNKLKKDFNVDTRIDRFKIR